MITVAVNGHPGSAFAVLSRLTGPEAAVTPKANPLVALYSAPACRPGSFMFVEFSAGRQFSRTNSSACTGSSMNFYIGGMLPETTYDMREVLVTGPRRHAGPVQQFTTGAIDATLSFPPVAIVQASTASFSASEDLLLLDYLSPPGGPYYFPTAVDLQGRVTWYYPALGVPAQNTNNFVRPVPHSQGHMLLIANDPLVAPDNGQILREIDLAGNTVAQTTACA